MEKVCHCSYFCVLELCEDPAVPSPKPNDAPSYTTLKVQGCLRVHMSICVVLN